jgi:hypothetical protein
MNFSHKDDVHEYMQMQRLLTIKIIEEFYDG